MPSLYLVPKKGAKFPYEAAKKKITGLPELTTSEVDFAALIQRCEDNDWPPELADKYRRLQAGGKCFEFEQACAPKVKGAFYEDNVYFAFNDMDHHQACEKVIGELAAALDLETSIGFSE